MRYVDRFFAAYDRLLEVIITVLFGIMVLILLGQVVSRYLFTFPMMWSAEIAQYIFIWIVYLGSALAFLTKRHLVVDIFSLKIPRPYSTYLTLILHVMILVFLFYVFRLGLQYAATNLSKPVYSVRWISLGWVYASVPIGALFMFVNILRGVIVPILMNSADATPHEPGPQTVAS